MDTPSSLPALSLAAGQCLHVSVDAGTVLVAVQGVLRVDEAPRWLADTLVPVGRKVSEGQTYRVTQSGWLRVTATGAAGAQLWQQAPAGLMARALQVLRRQLGACRPAACGR